MASSQGPIFADKNADTSSNGAKNCDVAHENEQERQSSTYMVFSSAGKLLYLSHDDGAQDWALTQASVMHAMLSLFGMQDQLQRICMNNSVNVSFLHRKPLYLACVAKKKEPDDIVSLRLERVYATIISLISHARLLRLFDRAPNLDLQALIGPMREYVDAVVLNMQSSLALAFGTVPIRPLDASVRDQVTRTCSELAPEKRPKQLLYILLWDSDDALISLSHLRRYVPHPTDLALINAVVRVGKDQDGWAPLCLPVFAPNSFAYVFSSVIGSARLALVCGDHDGYVLCRSWRHKLAESPCMAALQRALSMNPVSIDSMGLPGLRDVAFSSRRSQQCIISPRISAHRQTLFEHVLCALRGPAHAAEACPDLPWPRQPPVPRPLELVIKRTDQEAILGWRTAAFELCITTTPLLASSAIGELANRVVAWVRHRESFLFATASVF